VKFKRTYIPTPQHRQLYDDRFGTFVAIYRQMRGLYRKLNG